MTAVSNPILNPALIPATPAADTVSNIALDTVSNIALTQALTQGLTQEQADALLIRTGLSPLTEDHYCGEKGNHFYDLEDGRTVEITAQGEVFVYDFPEDDGKTPQKLDVSLATS